MTYRTWHRTPSTQPRGRLEQLPPGSAGWCPEFLPETADWPSSTESRPLILFNEALLVKPPTGGQAEWMFTFGWGFSLSAGGLKLYAFVNFHAFQQSIKSSTESELLWGCFIFCWNLDESLFLLWSKPSFASRKAQVNHETCLQESASQKCNMFAL